MWPTSGDVCQFFLQVQFLLILAGKFVPNSIYNLLGTILFSKKDYLIFSPFKSSFYFKFTLGYVASYLTRYIQCRLIATYYCLHFYTYQILSVCCTLYLWKYLIGWLIVDVTIIQLMYFLLKKQLNTIITMWK